MRKLPLLKLPLLLVLLLLSLMLLAAAASAKAASLPLVGDPTALFAPSPAPDKEAEEPEDESEGEESEEDEGEDCGAEADELCEEDGEDKAAEECLLEEADSSVVTVPGRDQVRLTVRYEAFEPTAVNVDAGLRGGKGALHLGSERVRFHRSGVYRDSFDLGPKQMPKALAAREFTVDLRAVGAPAGCELQLSTRGSRRAR
jgi:hypothetical protein